MINLINELIESSQTSSDVAWCLTCLFLIFMACMVLGFALMVIKKTGELPKT